MEASQSDGLWPWYFVHGESSLNNPFASYDRDFTPDDQELEKFVDGLFVAGGERAEAEESCIEVVAAGSGGDAKENNNGSSVSVGGKATKEQEGRLDCLGVNQ